MSSRRWVINNTRYADVSAATMAVIGDINATEFDAWLDANCLHPEICGISLRPSHVLKACDPDAYASSCLSWSSCLAPDIRKKLLGMDIEDDVVIQGVFVESTCMEHDGTVAGDDCEEIV